MRIIRYGRVFQAHKESPGTPEQQELAMAALTYEFGTPYDALNLRLAQAVKAPPSHQGWINVRFIELGPWLGHAQAVNLSLSVNLAGAGVANIAHHELGHLVAMWVLTIEQKLAYMERYQMKGSWPDADEMFALDMERWMKRDPGKLWMDEILT